MQRKGRVLSAYVCGCVCVDVERARACNVAGLMACERVLMASVRAGERAHAFSGLRRCWLELLVSLAPCCPPPSTSRQHPTSHRACTTLEGVLRAPQHRYPEAAAAAAA
eukprot:3019262-Rhodomonas_salina.1